jgi:hypothetical protein
LEDKDLKEFEMCCFFIWNFDKNLYIESKMEQPDFILKNLKDEKI